MKKKSFNPLNISHALFLIVGIYFCSFEAYSGAFFNGSCTSQGDWVTSALGQSRAILSAMESLKDDPNCAGIEKVIQKFKPASIIGAGRSQRVGPLLEVRKLAREISDLRMMADEGNASFRGQVMDVLMGNIADEAEKKSQINGFSLSRTAKNIERVSIRTAITLDTFAEGLSETLQVLPNLQSCFNNRPDQGLAITSGIVRLMGAFIDGGEGVTSRFGTLMANYVTFARNQKFAVSMSQINEKEYLASLSCLIESSAEAYCSAKDTSAILDDQKERRLADRIDDPSGNKNQLGGYHLLVRELPKISHWLQMVLNGLKPQMKAQADFQESVVESMNNLIKDKLALEGTYAQELKTYQETYKNSNSRNILSAKRAGVIKLLTRLTSIMYTRSRDNAQNFFLKARPLERAYFFLLNMPFPDALKKADAIMSPVIYLERNLDSIPALKNPDRTILNIEERIEEMLDEAMIFGTNYFTTWFIPDPTKVVDEAISLAPPNIFQSFKNINHYLDGITVYYINNRERRIEELTQEISFLQGQVASDKTKYGELKRAKQALQYFKGPTIYASVFDTRQRVTIVLEQFNRREILLKKIVDPKIADYFTKEGGIADNFFTDFLVNESCIDIPMAPRKKKCKDSYSAQLLTLDRKLLRTAFLQFNVMLQRDTFLTNRFFSYILAEYMERVQSGDEEDLYFRDLLAVTGRNIIDKLVSINRLNPNNARLDLNQAIPINFENLEAIEQLFADDLKVAICKVTARVADAQLEARKACGLLTEENVFSSRKGRNRSTGGSKTTGGILNQSTFNYGSRINLISKNDDELGHYAQLRAKYCIQALSFPTRWREFQEICSGTELVSQFSEEAEYDQVKVNFAFDDFSSESKTSEKICALRDYMRRNQVFWLLNHNN